MSWMRFAPTTYTHAHWHLCFGKGGLADKGVNFFTEYIIDCGDDGKFKVDTYIPHNVIVENDGASHMRESRRAKDAWKDRVLRKHGFTVLRFTDTHIQKQFDQVVDEIMMAR